MTVLLTQADLASMFAAIERQSVPGVPAWCCPLCEHVEESSHPVTGLWCPVCASPPGRRLVAMHRAVRPRTPARVAGELLAHDVAREGAQTE